MRRIFESIFEPISLFDYSIIWEICEMTNHYKNLRTDFIVRLFDYSIIWEIREMANHYKNLWTDLWTDLRTDLGTNFWIDFTVRLFDYLKNSWDGQSLQESSNRSWNRFSNQSWNRFSNRFHCSIIRFEKFVRWPIIRRIYIILVRCIFNLRMALKKMLIESISTKNMWLTVSIWNSTLFDVYSI